MELVYKFRNLSTDKHKRWLNNLEIFYSSPRFLNDPFDTAINLRYDLLEEEEQLQLYKKHIKIDNPKLSDDEVLKLAQEWMTKGLLKKENHLKMNKSIFWNMTAKTIGVLSLTKKKDHILLWSHYANYHAGFCIGYNKNGLEEYLERKYTSTKLVPFWFDVKYSQEYPILIPRGNLFDQLFFETQFGTKSKVWEYEEEYRILMLGGTDIQESIPKNLIVELTLGCNMKEDQRRHILAIIKEKKLDIPVYEAKKHDEKFELIFSLV